MTRVFLIETFNGKTWEPMVAGVDTKLLDAKITLEHCRQHGSELKRIAEYRRVAVVSEK